MTLLNGRFVELVEAQLWQVSVTALVVLCIVHACCRRRPHLAYALLLIVILKALTPPLIPSPASIFRGPTSPVPFRSVARTEESRIQSVARSADSAVDAGNVEFQEPQGLIGVRMTQTLRALRQPIAAEAAPAVPSDRPAGWWSLVFWIWGAGAASCAAAISLIWLRLERSLRAARRPAPRPLVELQRHLMDRLAIHRRVRLFVSDANHGPLAFGILRPCVVLPARLENASRSAVESMLAHELIHIRRGDTLVAALQTLCTVLWWFHPLIWLASRRISRERERACDDEVLAGTGCEPSFYAQGLLDVLREQRRSLSAMLVTGIRPVDVTKERLELIMNSQRNRSARTPWICWLMVILCLAVVLPAQRTGLAQQRAGENQATPGTVAPAPRSSEQPSRLPTGGKALIESPEPYSPPEHPGQRLPENQRVEFGPVIEMMIHEDRPGREFLIDLDAGKAFTLPADFKPSDEKEFFQWCLQKGIDLIGEGEYAFGQDMIAIPTAEFNWNPQRAILNQVEQGKPGSPIPIMPRGTSPTTFLIKTREGSIGVLQIMQVGRGAKIRYRLAKPNPAAAAPAAAARANSAAPARPAKAADVEVNIDWDLVANSATAARQAEAERNRQVDEQVRQLIGKFVEAARDNNRDAAVPLFVDAGRGLPSVADYREIAAQGVDPGKIAKVVVGGDSALAISEFFDSSQGVPNSQRRHCVVYTCQLKDGKWLIRDIDLEPVAGLVDEIERFLR
jgi:beta-lactamase regulating signal transducer with metallopeptidase domain